MRHSNLLDRTFWTTIFIYMLCGNFYISKYDMSSSDRSRLKFPINAWVLNASSFSLLSSLMMGFFISVLSSND